MCKATEVSTSCWVPRAEEDWQGLNVVSGPQLHQLRESKARDPAGGKWSAGKNRVKDGRDQFNLMPTELGHQETLQTKGQGFQCTCCLGPDGLKHWEDMGLYTLKMVTFMLCESYLQQNKAGLWGACGQSSLLIKAHGTQHQGTTRGSGKHALWGSVQVAGMSKKKKMGTMKPLQEICTFWATLPCGTGLLVML